jgi:predicted DNA-binding WGR domain protein
MKIFFYMGRNPSTRSGVSWKIWKISRRGKTVTTHWGPAELFRRKVVHSASARSKVRKFKTLSDAIVFESRIIRSKLYKGYQRRTRWR